MKIKENKEISFYGRLPLILLLCCGATVVIRTVQLLFFIEREAGFYNGGDFLKIALYLILAVACVFFALTAYMSKQTAEISLNLKKDKTLSTISLILSLSFLYDSLSSFSGSFSSLGGASHGASAFQSMMLSGTIPQFFQSIFAFLSAIYFFVLAKGMMKENNSVSRHKLLAVAPVGWAGFRLVHRFVEQISYVRVSELLLELILLALFVLFFMAFAQVASGVYVKNARWRIIGIGLPAALFSFTLNIPRLIFALSVGVDALYSKYPFRVCDFVLAIFITALAIKLINENGKAVEACDQE